MNKMICPYCEKEVEEGSLICPHCGKSLEEGAEKEEVVKPLQEEVKEELETEVKEEVIETKDEVKEVHEETEIAKPAKSKKNIIIASIIGVVVLIAIVFGVKSYLDKKAHEEYVKEYNAYVDLVKETQMTMLNGAVQVENTSNQLVKVWSNAIWKKDDVETDPYTKLGGVFVSDFNTAISSYLMAPDTIKQQVAIESSQSKASDAMKKLKEVPVGLESHYEDISDMYDVFMEFTNLGLNPSGSLTTYRQNITSLDTKLVNEYDKVGRLDFTKIK